MNNQIRFYACLTIIGCMNLMACSSIHNSSTHYPIKRNTVLELQQPCQFIDNQGIDSLIPTDSSDFALYSDYAKGIVPKGTKIRFLGAYTESGFMVDTHVRTYGLILEGEFQHKKVNLDYVMRTQFDIDQEARIEIERETLQQ